MSRGSFSFATLWEADFALETARASADRGGAYYVAGCLFRCASIVLQVLFALNERYWINEKGAMEVARQFSLRPRGLDALHTVLASPGSAPAELRASIREVEAVVVRLRALVEDRS